MDSELIDSVTETNIIAIPYPGRGHLNPMMCFCKLIALTRPTLIITFIVTEEWRGLLSSESFPENINFATIPNVIPSEKVRGENLAAFGYAVMTKMEPEVDRVLDHIKVSEHRIILSDSFLIWPLMIGKRRNIPVASFWTMAATQFSIWYELLLRREDSQFSESEPGEELVDIMGTHLPGQVGNKYQELVKFVLEIVAAITREAKYLLFASPYELESEAIDNLKTKFPIPIYCIGPAIPYFRGEEVFGQITGHEYDGQSYFEWLDAQPRASVLYISQGSFGSVSREQLDENVAAVLDSGVRFLWVVRQDAISLPQGGGNTKGFAVPWCDQLKVLCHPSVAGFWSHCGWNSTKEAVFAGVPVLTFPLMWDQIPNSKKILEDWKIGCEVGRGDESLVTRAEISRTLKRFMDLENDEGKEMRRRAQKLRDICLRSTAEGGSSELAIQDFIKKILT